MTFSTVFSAASALESESLVSEQTSSGFLFELTDNIERGRLIGMDEAGYGPNLGPLVLASTVWEVPGDPQTVDLADLLRDVVDTRSHARWTRLHMADSKLVNVGKEGLRSLETTALALLHTNALTPATLQQLLSVVTGDPFVPTEPWELADLVIPVAADPVQIHARSSELQSCLLRQQVALAAIRVTLVSPRKFNALLTEHGSKGVLLTHEAMQLLGRVWDVNDSLPTLFIGDKHGGRNRYDDDLREVVNDAFIMRLEESRQVSRYRVQQTELRFQMQGEQHLPVAAASIVAKYIRELTMLQFNAFWQQHLPDLHPTKGYPVDARRYLQQIDPLRQQLNVDLSTLWRER